MYAGTSTSRMQQLSRAWNRPQVCVVRERVPGCACMQTYANVLPSTSASPKGPGPEAAGRLQVACTGCCERCSGHAHVASCRDDSSLFFLLPFLLVPWRRLFDRLDEEEGLGSLSLFLFASVSPLVSLVRPAGFMLLPV